MGSKLRAIGAVVDEPSLRWRFGCTGKEGFASMALAQEVAARRNRFGREKGRVAGEAYRCATCGKHHIGDPQLAPTSPRVLRRTGSDG